jgi:uncharacterized membrane protein YgaE (UPF0421/DUF939 family)
MTGLVEILLAIGAGAAALFALMVRSRRKGRREAEEKIEAQAAEDYQETRERIDDATGRTDGADDDRSWLQQYGDGGASER